MVDMFPGIHDLTFSRGGKSWRIRMVKFKLNQKEMEPLLTSLPDDLALEDLRKFSFRRWPAETNYNILKNRLKIPRKHTECHPPEFLSKEDSGNHPPGFYYCLAALCTDARKMFRKPQIHAKQVSTFRRNQTDRFLSSSGILWNNFLYTSTEISWFRFDSYTHF